MCVTTYLKAMLTDGFLLSVSSRAANYAPHKTIMLHGELSATSPAHHRMAINHLLHRLIYNALLRTRCHTQTESMITTQRVVDALICLFIKGFPCTWFFKVWAGRSRTYGDALSFRVKDFSLPALSKLWNWKIYSIVSMPMIFSPMISAENTVIVNMVQRRYSFTVSFSAEPKIFSLNCFNIALSYF